MLVIGRITHDAIINTLKDERQVVNFSIAINDYFKPKGATEGRKFTTFVNCAYWISIKIADRLKKGTLVEVSGRIFATAYSDNAGNAKASINLHANSIKIHSSPKEVEALGTHVVVSNEDKADDLPF